MCGRQDSIILRCEFRRAEIQQLSTGLLHLHGFKSAAISGAGDRTRVHYGAPGGNAGWQQSTGLLHLHGFEPVAYTKIKKEPAGSFFILVPLTGLEPVRSCPQRILSPRCLPFHHSGGFAYFSTRRGNRQVTDQKSAVKWVTADPDSGRRLPGSAPRTNSAPADP